MAHLNNNGGVQAHSADEDFSLYGVTKFAYLRHGKAVRMLRCPDGRELPRSEWDRLRRLSKQREFIVERFTSRRTIQRLVS